MDVLVNLDNGNKANDQCILYISVTRTIIED